MDIDGLAGEPDPNWRIADHYDNGSPLGLHFSTLYDQDTDESGERYDLATGLPYRNSGENDLLGLHVDDGEILSDMLPDALALLSTKGLEAWVRENMGIKGEDYSSDSAAA